MEKKKLANGKKISELGNAAINVLDCNSKETLLVAGSAQERYAVINAILDSIRVDFPEEQTRDEDDPKYILRSIEFDGMFYPNYERTEIEDEESVVLEV